MAHPRGSGRGGAHAGEWAVTGVADLLAGPIAALSALGGTLLVLPVLLPLAGLLLALAFGGRHTARIARAAIALGLLAAVAIAVAVLEAGAPLRYDLGGWAPPLGVALPCRRTGSPPSCCSPAR